MRAAVTGGAGFIGSHVVDALVARGDEVHVVDNFATGRRENLTPQATLHERDIREPLDELFAEIRAEVVVHLAAQADVGTSVERPLFDAEVNVIGTLNVLEAARPHGAQVVFSSTGGAIYGECERPAREDDERRPLSPYGTAKLAAEEYLATWNRLYGTRHVALRFANVYGPRQLAKLEGGVVAIFTDRLRSGAPVTIFGDGEQTRDYIYVGDVVAAVLAAIGRDGGVYNVGTGSETAVNELFEQCRRVAGVDAEPTHAPARPGDVLHSVLDVSRSERELEWRPQTPLAEGLRLTWG
ncbi:MAG TPA: NAD-dependent epimerase/dehydratase family protein [Solirubrobacteraceae bacterium]|nr:NAD-dependent epimerase/dehydratase family protein [Solirubrobacteraceae bacterium]